MISIKSIFQYPKRFCHNYSNVTDFLSASLIICICLIVLLPKVHESFKSDTEKHAHNSQFSNEHDHDHEIPIGEIIICSGFFLFYCIGLYLNGPFILRQPKTRSPVKRRDSTICCSSTRCPTSPLPNGSQADTIARAIAPDLSIGYLPNMMETTSLITARNPDDDCVLLLNRHHNHHMHTRHHEHKSPDQPNPANTKYGSTSSKRDGNQETNSMIEGLSKPSSEMFQGEINITLLPRHGDGTKRLDWPRSIKVTLLCVILAGLMIALDMQLQGILEAIKVFRAAATGALLYSAFFLILPKDSAGCNSCEEDDCEDD